MTPPEVIIISDDSSDESDTYYPKWDDHHYMNSIISKSKLARYILDQRLPMAEVLIDHDEEKCDRKSLLTLFSDVVVDPVVITNLAYQRTAYELTIRMGLEKEISCFLPANLHVFLPMIDNEHWYMVVMSLKEKKVYMGVCFPDPSRVVIRTEATIFMMKFTSQLLRLVYAKHGSIDKCPSISDFQLEVPRIHLYPPAKNKHDFGLWVCTWIAVDSKDPFKECGPNFLRKCKELAVNLVVGLENSVRKKVLTKVATYHTYRRQGVAEVRRQLDFEG